MRKFSILCLLFFFNITLKAQEKINWLSFEEAIELNQKNPKPILIDVYTDWCGYCKKMDIETYENEVIAKYVNTHFYAIKMDGEGKEDITFKDHVFKFQQQGRTKYHELAATLLEGKLAYPTTLFLNEDEQVLQKIPGYLPTKDFEKILNFYSNKIYKTKNWTEFEKDFKSNLKG